MTILNLQLGVFDGSAIGCQRRIQRFKDGLLQLVFLTRHHARFEQRFITLRIRFGILGIRGILRQRRLGLLHGLFERTGIDLEDQLALADIIAFGKKYVRQLARDQRFYTDGRKRFDVRDGVNFHGNRALGDLGDGNRNGRAFSRSCRPRWVRFARSAKEEQCREDERACSV